MQTGPSESTGIAFESEGASRVDKMATLIAKIEPSLSGISTFFAKRECPQKDPSKVKCFNCHKRLLQ